MSYLCSLSSRQSCRYTCALYQDFEHNSVFYHLIVAEYLLWFLAGNCHFFSVPSSNPLKFVPISAMGDAESDLQPSKKRAAGVQLSRDNPGLEDDEETSEQEAGTFKRASDEVLAARRILKVRRQQTSSTPSATEPTPTSNPFSAIRLVPPASAPVAVAEASCVTVKKNEQSDKNNSESENVTDEPKDKFSADVKPSEGKVEESKVEFNSEKDESNIVGEQSIAKSAVGEVTEGEDSGTVAKKAAEADNSENESRKDVDGKEKAEEKGNGEATTEKTASFSSFQQLSSSQKHFLLGSLSISFSFGSIPKDGSALGSTTGSLFGLKNNQPSFGFGISNNGNSSIFGTSGTNLADKSEGNKLPTMQEVAVETGEENEKAVFTSDAVVFEFIDGAWKERGKGELKINVPTTGTGKGRLIMRARGNYRLILNASLFPDMKLTNMDKKGITFACVNTASEGKDGLSTIALKFKDASIVEDFRAAVMEHKSKTAAALKTPENSHRHRINN
ncbi:UNVERIFIED_CONTAM: Nuclear pore complex protein A [Sesamum latifolium]|uniref:Nuclear pore complex protein A n=1 Tax=Sesamum latifolium TaxID=2727402 RepID=A0AAW2YDX5_9LAMI